jgi:hypothetical protein
LAEKSRLANENSIYARENRFLREIVECHQLTMQDIVYIDEIPPSVSPPEMTEIFPVPMPPQENKDVVESEVPQSLSSSVAEEEDTKTPIYLPK